jgi:hypothetical protein
MDLRKPLGLLAALVLSPALAGPADPFAGTWTIDLRPPGQGVAGCDRATLELRQEGRQIRGSYRQADASCAPLEDGARVVGQATRKVATLEIHSSRNGAVVRGRAVVRGDKLFWQARNVVVHGKPEGDERSLNRGILSRSAVPGGDGVAPALTSVGPASAKLPPAASPRP